MFQLCLNLIYFLPKTSCIFSVTGFTKNPGYAKEGLMLRTTSGKKSKTIGEISVDAQLAHSMDGRHWLRGVRDPLFANGPPGSPTAGLVYPNSALLPSGAQPTAFERRLDVSELETCLLALQREDQATRGGTIFCCTHPPRQSSTARCPARTATLQGRS